MPEDNILQMKLRNVLACLSTKKRFRIFTIKDHVRLVTSRIITANRNYKVEFKKTGGPSGEFMMAMITVEEEGESHA